MKHILISYADGKYIKSQDRLHATAIKYGVDETIKYNRDSLINSDFYLSNKHILDQKRGGGYWLWKPYIILQTLKSMENGDILIYADSGMYVLSSLKSLFELTKYSDVCLFNANHIQRFWTKRDCFLLMDADTSLYWDSLQAGGFLQIYKKSQFSLDFVETWLNFCCDERILTDMSNSLNKPNLLGFIEHRHDQSVLSNLRVKYGLSLFPDPTQYGGFISRKFFDTRVTYNTVFLHHRMHMDNFLVYYIKYILITLKRLIVSNPI